LAGENVNMELPLGESGEVTVFTYHLIILINWQLSEFFPVSILSLWKFPNPIFVKKEILAIGTCSAVRSADEGIILAKIH
jgi:hypothetical protein